MGERSQKVQKASAYRLVASRCQCAKDSNQKQMSDFIGVMEERAQRVQKASAYPLFASRCQCARDSNQKQMSDFIGVLEGVSGKGLWTHACSLVVVDGAAVECGYAAVNIDSASLRCKNTKRSALHRRDGGKGKESSEGECVPPGRQSVSMRKRFESETDVRLHRRGLWKKGCAQFCHP